MTKAIAWAFDRKVRATDELLAHWRDRYSDARFLFLAMKEFGEMERNGNGQFLKKIELSHDQSCKEITKPMLDKYSDWLHAKVYPPASPASVKHIAGDGHEKILTKICAGDKVPMKQRKGKNGRKLLYANGWFMIMDAAGGRVLSVQQQFEPENNEVVTVALEKVIDQYKNAKTFIMDRNCKYAPKNKSRQKLRKIRTWAIDKFHAKRHGKKCPCNPYKHKLTMRALKGVNTSVCEQVWSWFRNYAAVFNHMNSRCPSALAVRTVCGLSGFDH